MGEQAREAMVAWGAAGRAGGARSNKTVVLALGGFEKNQVGCCASARRNAEHYLNAEHLGALATDAAGELDVLGHDGDALGVDGAQVGVLEEANELRWGRE